MDEEIIARARDAFGNEVALSASAIYGTIMEMLKVSYCDFMVRSKDGDYIAWRQFHIEKLGEIMDYIHAKYADHAEGIKREVFRYNGKLYVTREEI